MAFLRNNCCHEKGNNAFLLCCWPTPSCQQYKTLRYCQALRRSYNIFSKCCEQYRCLHVKCPTFFPDLNQISNFSTDFLLIRAAVIHADRLRDRYNDANVRFSLLIWMGLNIILRYFHFLGTEKLRIAQAVQMSPTLWHSKAHCCILLGCTIG